MSTSFFLKKIICKNKIPQEKYDYLLTQTHKFDIINITHAKGDKA